MNTTTTTQVVILAILTTLRLLSLLPFSLEEKPITRYFYEDTERPFLRN